MKRIHHVIFCFIIALRLLLAPTAYASPLEDTKAELEQQLHEVEQLISQYENDLLITRHEKQTLLGKIKQLKNQQSTLRLQIKATNLKIKQLGSKLAITEEAINNKSTRLERLRQQLYVVMRAVHQEDNDMFISLASSQGLSGIYNEIENYSKLSSALQRILVETRTAKKELQHQQVIFDGQKDDAQHLLEVKSLQQKELLGTIDEHSALLEETNGKENNYQALLADTKKRATAIRNRIYELFGGARQINFGEAVAIAKWVGQQTSVRPAFILAILTQESNLGKNVGTCNRPGDPPEKNWRVIMKPDRDQEPFLQITKELNLDPDTTPVSCPMKDKKGKQFGWGGAMGPAQFIPSTWMGIKSSVSSITGKSANPWDIRDAFIAASLKLSKEGAKEGKDGEWKAALRYFSGSNNTKYRFYADNVAAIAERYEKDIADLEPI